MEFMQDPTQFGHVANGAEPHETQQNGISMAPAAIVDVAVADTEPRAMNHPIDIGQTVANDAPCHGHQIDKLEIKTEKQSDDIEARCFQARVLQGPSASIRNESSLEEIPNTQMGIGTVNVPTDSKTMNGTFAEGKGAVGVTLKNFGTVKAFGTAAIMANHNSSTSQVLQVNPRKRKRVSFASRAFIESKTILERMGGTLDMDSPRYTRAYFRSNVIASDLEDEPPRKRFRFDAGCKTVINGSKFERFLYPIKDGQINPPATRGRPRGSTARRGGTRDGGARGGGIARRGRPYKNISRRDYGCQAVVPGEGIADFKIFKTAAKRGEKMAKKPAAKAARS